MKAEADLHFLCGINQIICHGWPYTAEGASYPGWSFYAAAVFDEKNPWWIVMPDVTKYLQRVSYILRQGTPANDVALFLPNSDAWASFGRNFSINAALAGTAAGPVKAITDAGYNLDFFDDQLLAMRGAVSGNTLAFGDVHYRAVVLPGVERIPVATMQTLEKFAKAGGIIIATRRLPDLAPGYLATAADTQTVRDIAQRLFKDANAPGIFISDETQLGSALAKQLSPDVAISAAPEIGFVHRHTGDSEIYFVANTGNQPKDVQATFRVEGMQPEIWDPMNGRVKPAAIIATTARVAGTPANVRGVPDGTTSVNLKLEPYESTIVAFTKRTLPAQKKSEFLGELPSPIDLSSNWTVTFGKGWNVTSVNGSMKVAMDKLTSWIDLPNEKNFSGVATYEKTVNVEPGMLNNSLSVSFDFGQGKPSQERAGGQGYHASLDAPVREAAIVYVNDQRVGSVWCAPYAIDVTGKLKAGENKIRIEVANLAVNYMASIKLPNYDYAGVTEKYGSRFQPQGLNLIQPLPSGLLGPVRLVATVAQ